MKTTIRKACQVCSLRLGEYSCKNCGKFVCRNDFDNVIGICVDCKHGKKV